MEGNGTPTTGELGRSIDRLSIDIREMGVELRALADVPRRVESLEETIKKGQDRKAGATWGVAQNIVATIVAAVIISLIINGGIK